MYQKTNNDAFLQSAIEQVEGALGKGKQNVGESLSAMDYFAIIRNLVEGSDTFNIKIHKRY